MTQLPPYARLLGLQEDMQCDGVPRLMMPHADPVIGRPGFLHGSAITGLLEMAAIVMLQHALSKKGLATPLKPIGVSVDSMRGERDKPTQAASVITRLGGRVANVEATAWQDQPDRSIAKARMHYLLARD